MFDYTEKIHLVKAIRSTRYPSLRHVFRQTAIPPLLLREFVCVFRLISVTFCDGKSGKRLMIDFLIKMCYNKRTNEENEVLL